MIDDLALRWIVTALFAAGIAGYVYIIVAQPVQWKCTVNHLLHLAMSAAMIVMAWPTGMSLPTIGPMIFFLLAAVWFAIAPGRAPGNISARVINSYHAVKMAAMAWMYAVMSGSLPGQACHPSDHTRAFSPGSHMAGMDMSGPEASWSAAEPEWIATVNAFASVGFAAAAVYWLYRYLDHRRIEPVARRAYLTHLAPLCQAFMATGTAIMFGVTF